ncbi:hypothetical protein HG535_0A08340 [Zygotorulaspora mrakii]|uniref:Amino acid permease/ SLC12A domain-containing protein n=1 Tax=Zygotorulaspora mrakii TaxID=42260 RepID=A0A7H9AWU4_ZYGMR|nr:uncharacterized protein HG535_0A08340 [Zygotorulaspora mrakii]QLG70888.1 hypothetical protein HG535_0A08340 [Zygotorulaspora mrakii]
MGPLSPLQELFPESNNIEISGFQNESEHDSDDTRGHQDDAESSADSVLTGILKAIMEEQQWHDVKDYQVASLSDRFYISDLYARRKECIMDKMTKDLSKQKTYTNDSNEFKKYNERVRKEYELREKIEYLLRQQQHGDVKVLSESSIYEQYFAGRDLKTLKGASCHGPKTRITSVLKHLHLRKDAGTEQRLISDETSSKASTHTYVIDNASYGQMAIDEGSFPINKFETELLSALEEKTDSYSNEEEEKPSFIAKLWKIVKDPHNDEYHVQRKLRVRHMQMIGVGACLSVGIFLTSGKAFSSAGPFGTLLGFALTGSVVLATLLSFTELSTLIPVSSGFSGLASRFVEDAFGFALGWTYWFSCMIALPAQVLSSTFYLSYYPNLNMSKGRTAGFVILFLMFDILVNLVDVRVLGEVVYVVGILKIFITLGIIIAMLILNAGHGGSSHDQVGFRYWDSSKTSGNLTYGMFRPTFDLSDTGNGSTHGISGSGGRFLAVMSVVLISTFAYSGAEMPFLASGEAINPRKTIPSAIKRTFCIVLILYIFVLLSVGINFYSGDPRLLAYYSGSTKERSLSVANGVGTNWQMNNHCQAGMYSNLQNNNYSYSSPWVLALQNFGLCTFASFFNGILIFFTTAAGISSLFSSSRTLYSMAVQRKAPSIFQKCSKNGIPYVSVLFSGLFGGLAYLAVDKTARENFDVLSNISSASTSIIWMGLNLSFLRFFYALKKRKDIISRDDKSYPYRSPLQPYLAVYGLVGCSLFIIFMGYTNFIHTYWSTKSFFSAYGGLMLFTICYIGYKVFGTSKIQRLDQLNMDSGRREMDRMFWNESRQYSGPYRERLKKLVNWLY